MSLQVEQHPRPTPHQGRVEFGRSSRASSPCYLFPAIEICKYKVLREPEMHTHKCLFQTSTHLAKERGQKASKIESERQENYKARTSQTQTQNPSAPFRPSRAHGIGRKIEFFLAIVTCTTAIEVHDTNSPLPAYHSILPPPNGGQIQRPNQLIDARATMKAPSSSKANGARRAPLDSRSWP